MQNQPASQPYSVLLGRDCEDPAEEALSGREEALFACSALGLGTEFLEDQGDGLWIVGLSDADVAILERDGELCKAALGMALVAFLD